MIRSEQRLSTNWQSHWTYQLGQPLTLSSMKKSGKLDDAACPCNVETALGSFAARLKEVNGENLVGAYVFGSIARQSYHPQTSDADVLVVTTKPCRERAENITPEGRYAYKTR